MRVGSLCGSDYLPQGWEEGRDINTTNSLIRYLGIFLGTPAGRGSSQVGRDGHSQNEEALRAMAGTRDTAVATRSEYRHPKPCMCKHVYLLLEKLFRSTPVPDIGERLDGASN